MKPFGIDFSKIRAIVIMLYKWKDKNSRLLTLLPVLLGVISVIASLSSFNRDMLYPFSLQNLNLDIVISELFPLLIILALYDVVSSQNQSGIMKKILSEPVSVLEIFLSIFLFVLAYTLVMSISIVVPGFLVSTIASRVKNPQEELRFLSILFPTFTYGLFWGLLTISYSARSSSSFKSLGFSIITLVIFSYFLSYFLNSGLSFLFPAFGINPNSAEANGLVGMVNSILPVPSVSNSISILAVPSILRYNLYPYPGSGGTFVYSFDGHISSLLAALYFSLLAIIPLIVYILVSFLFLFFGVKRIPRLF